MSQWEKPREWIERERERDRFRNRDRERDDRYRDGSSRSSMRKSLVPRINFQRFDTFGFFLTGHDKHSNSRGSNGSGSSKDAPRHWSSNSGSSKEAPEGPIKESSTDW